MNTYYYIQKPKRISFQQLSPFLGLEPSRRHTVLLQSLFVFCLVYNYEMPLTLILDRFSASSPLDLTPNFGQKFN